MVQMTRLSGLRGWPLLALAFLVHPAMAQNGEPMGGDYPRGAEMMNHAGMHSDDIMEQMSLMIDQMSQMVEEIHGFHAHVVDTWTEEMAGGGDQGMSVMLAMANEMEEIGPHMDRMIENLQQWMEGAGGDGMDEDTARDAMNELAEQIDTMIKAGHGVMSVIDDVGSGREAGHGESSHAGRVAGAGPADMDH